MLYLDEKRTYASVSYGNESIELVELNRYFKYLNIVKKNAPLTIKDNMFAVYHFWLWTLVNELQETEDIQLYLARYLESMENGFSIINVIKLEEYNEEHEYQLYKCTPKKQSTINKEKASVEAFLKYMKTPQIKDLQLEKNFFAYNKKAKYNKGSGYGLKMSKYLQTILIDDMPIVETKSNQVYGDLKAFPYKLFEPLLEIAEPRDRLLFLLAGACSARVNQALNLTFYDIDYTSKNVWLIDPRKNDQLGYHGKGRKDFLMSEYYIDAKKDKAHKSFGFKYPIPTKFIARDPLFWLHKRYKGLFFKTLLEYKPVPEHARNPRHPFFFVRSTGNRFTDSEINRKLEKYIKILIEKYPEYKYKLEGCTMHSLRHMFGSVMAAVEAKLVMKGNSIAADRIRSHTSYAMGHKDPKSTEVYFNRPWDLDVELGEYVQSLIQIEI